MIRVWIAYEPQVFRELLIAVIAMSAAVEIVENASEEVDIGIFRLAETGQLQAFFRSRILQHAKMIVFSPRGDQAYIRLAEEKVWAEVTPFGIQQLLAEIYAGRCARAIGARRKQESLAAV